MKFYFALVTADGVHDHYHAHEPTEGIVQHRDIFTTVIQVAAPDDVDAYGRALIAAVEIYPLTQAEHHRVTLFHFDEIGLLRALLHSQALKPDDVLTILADHAKTKGTDYDHAGDQRSG